MCKITDLVQKCALAKLKNIDTLLKNIFGENRFPMTSLINWVIN